MPLAPEAAAYPWGGLPLPAQPWVLPPGSMVLTTPLASQPSPGPAVPVTAGGVTYYPPPAGSVAPEVSAPPAGSYPHPAGLVGMETPAFPAGYYGGMVPGTWGTPHTPVPYLYGDAGGAGPLPTGPYLPYWGLPHAGAGGMPYQQLPFLPYGAPGHTPYPYPPLEPPLAYPGWGPAGTQWTPPDPTPLETLTGGVPSTPPSRPRSVASALEQEGGEHSPAGLAPDPATLSFSAGQPRPDSAVLPGTSPAYSPGSSAERPCPSRPQGQKSGSFSAGQLRRGATTFPGTTPAYSPESSAEAPGPSRLQRRKSVSFEKDAGRAAETDEGAQPPAPGDPPGEPLAGPALGPHEAPEQQGVDSGEPRAERWVKVEP